MTPDSAGTYILKPKQGADRAHAENASEDHWYDIMPGSDAESEDAYMATVDGEPRLSVSEVRRNGKGPDVDSLPIDIASSNGNQKKNLGPRRRTRRSTSARKQRVRQEVKVWPGSKVSWWCTQEANLLSSGNVSLRGPTTLRSAWNLGQTLPKSSLFMPLFDNPDLSLFLRQ